MNKVLLVLALALSAVLSAQEVTIVSIGTGANRSEAQNDAIRSALESTLSFMTTNTTIENDVIVKDEINIISQSEVSESKILDERELPNGSYYVQMEVKLSEKHLVDYFQRTGTSEIEFKGSLFANNITRLQLNEKTELKAIQDLLSMAEQYSGNTMNYYLVDATSPKLNRKTEKWEISTTVEGQLNANHDELASLLIPGLKSIALSANENKKRNSYNMKSVSFKIKAGKNSLFTYTFRNPMSIQYLEEFQIKLSETYDDFYLLVDKAPAPMRKQKVVPIMYNVYPRSDMSSLFPKSGAKLKWIFSEEVTQDELGSMTSLSLSKGVVEDVDSKSKKNFNKLLTQNKSKVALYLNIGTELNYLRDFNYPIINHQQQVNAVTTTNINQEDYFFSILTYPTSASVNEYFNKASMGTRLFERTDVNFSYSRGESEIISWYKSTINVNYILAPATSIIRYSVGAQRCMFTGTSLNGILIKDDNNNTVVLNDYNTNYTQLFTGLNLGLMLDYQYLNLAGQLSILQDSEIGTIVSTSLSLGIDLN